MFKQQRKRLVSFVVKCLSKTVKHQHDTTILVKTGSGRNHQQILNLGGNFNEENGLKVSLHRPFISCKGFKKKKKQQLQSGEMEQNPDQVIRINITKERQWTLCIVFHPRMQSESNHQKTSDKQNGECSVREKRGWEQYSLKMSKKGHGNASH